MKKQLAMGAVALALVGTGLFAATSVSAQDANPHNTLVQRIADRFGLNHDEVQAVFEEDRKEHMAKMEAAYEDRLTKLVGEGKITEAQKQLILAKHNDMRADHQSKFETFKDMTDEERKAAMQKHKQEIDDWAKQNGIDPQYLFGGGHAGKFIMKLN